MFLRIILKYLLRWLIPEFLLGVVSLSKKVEKALGEIINIIPIN